MTILGIGDAPHPLCTSGFGRVTGELFYRVARATDAIGDRVQGADGWTAQLQRPKFDFHWLGIHSKGDAVPKDSPLTIWHCADQRVSCQRAVEVFAAVQPDLLIVFSDLAVCGQWVASIADSCGGPLPCPLIVYCPVDGANLLPGLAGWVNEYTIPERVRWATYTTWGCTELFKCLINAGVVPGGGKMYRIPHSVDQTTFAPMDQQEARKIIFPDGSQDDSWIVLNANTNSPRKRADLTVLGFAKFLSELLGTSKHTEAVPPDTGMTLVEYAEKSNDPVIRKIASLASEDHKPPKVRLYMHMDPQGTFPIVDIFAAECANYGITNWQDFLICPQHQEMHGKADDWYRALYAACDVGISTSAGEGWGLCQWEHAAMGKPQIVPQHTAFQELFNPDNAYLVRPCFRCSTPDHGQDQMLVDYEDVSEFIMSAYTWGRESDGRKIPENAHIAATAWTWDDAAQVMVGMIEDAGRA